MAVLAVVLFHAGVPRVGGGFVGVDVFFVISGFLITGLLWREVSTSGTVRLGRFYGARARRLLPASALVGVVIMIGSAVLLPPLLSRNIIDDGIACALYVGNYRFALQGTNYFSSQARPSPFQHYWSLGVEEQFYVVWPALIIGTAWFIRRVRRRAGAHATSPQTPYLVVLALVGAVSFAVSLVLTHTAPSMAFFSLPTRAWELAAGGLVALTATHWRRLPASTCRNRGLGRSSPDPAGLHPVGFDHTLSGYCRAVARAGHGTGDRRGLCCTVAGMRPRPGMADRCKRSAGCPTRGICGTGRWWWWCSCMQRPCSAMPCGWGWQRS